MTPFLLLFGLISAGAIGAGCFLIWRRLPAVRRPLPSEVARIPDVDDTSTHVSKQIPDQATSQE